MSLIFEALRKLEREKQAPERGILVVGPSTWAGRGATSVRLGLVAVVALGLVGAGVLIGAFLRRPPQAPTPAAAPASSAPAPALDTGAASSGSAAPAPVAPAPSAPAGGAPRQLAPAPGAGVPGPAAKPAPTPSPAQAELVLQAVTEQDGTPVALINDRLLREGDAFDGVKVLRIAPGEVEVEIEATGERRVLRF